MKFFTKSLCISLLISSASILAMNAPDKPDQEAAYDRKVESENTANDIIAGLRNLPLDPVERQVCIQNARIYVDTLGLEIDNMTRWGYSKLVRTIAISQGRLRKELDHLNEEI